MSEELSGGLDTAAELQKEPPRSAGAELILPVSAIVFTIYYFTTIWHAPWTAQVSAFFIGTVLILCSTAVIARTVFAVARGKMKLDFERLIAPHNFIVKRLVLFALTVAYIEAIPWSGFTITTFAFLVMAMLLLNNGKRPWLIAALSLVLSVGGWALFELAFQVRFPQGPFETFVRGLM